MYIKKINPAGGAGAPVADAAPADPTLVVDVDGRELSAAAPVKQSMGLFMKSKPAAAPAAKPEKSPASKGFFSKLTAKKAAPAAERRTEPAADDVQIKDEKPAVAKTSGLLARLGKKPAPEGGARAEAPPKEGKTVKAAKRVNPAKSVATGKAAKSIAVLVELEDGKQVAWNVTSSGMESTEFSGTGRALSFSARDQRYGTDGPLSATAAQSLALSEIGEDVRAINATKQLKAVYATTAERAKEFGDAFVGPGLLVLESLLKGNSDDTQDRIVGLQLSDSDGSIGLVVLYHFNAQGDAGPAQVTVNPTDLSFVLAQFVSARRLDMDTTKVVLVSNEDLLKGTAFFKAYPNQAMFFGMPVSKVLNGAATFSVVAAVAASAWAGYGYTLKQSADASLRRATVAKTEALDSANELLTSGVLSFAKTQALDLQTTMAKANAVWVPGSRVTLEAKVDGSTYGVRMPMLRGTNVAGRPSVLDRTGQDQVDALLKLAAPDGCTKSIVNFSGALNAAQVTVECENGPGPLSAYHLE